MPFRSVLGRSTALACIVLLAGCGDNAAEPEDAALPPTGTFVGKVADTDAYLAVVAGTQTLVAFIGDGANRTCIPFGGVRAEAGATHLAGRVDGQLDVTITVGAATGTIQFAGSQHRFSLDPARDRAGLYRAAGKVATFPVWAAWVVLNDGSQRGAGATANGVVLAPPIDADAQTFTVDGTTAPVSKVEPDAPAGMVEDPGTTFSGGAGFQGGFVQFGGFTGFGGGGFQGGFGTGFQAGFGSGAGFNAGAGFAGKQLGFGGGGFNPGSAPGGPTRRHDGR